MNYSQIFSSSKIIAFDLETTGVNVKNDRVVEIALVEFQEGRSLTIFQTLVNPECPIPLESSEIHGIYDNDVRDRPVFSQVAPQIASLLEKGTEQEKKTYLLGYNAWAFDVPLLNNEFRRAGNTTHISTNKVIDPLIFVRWHLRNLRKHSLSILCSQFNISLTRAHSAADDAEGAGWLFLKLVELGYISGTLENILQEQARLADLLYRERNNYSYWLYHDRQTGDLRLGAGKYQGVLMEEVPIEYLKMLLSHVVDLPVKVKEIFISRCKQEAGQIDNQKVGQNLLLPF